MLPRVILFDIDDTLIDHKKAARAALLRVQRENDSLGNVELSELEVLWSSDFHYYWSKLLEGEATIEENRTTRFINILKQLGAPTVGAELLAKAYGEEYMRTISPVAGSHELLQKLKRKGIEISLVSNNLREMQMQKMNKCGLQNYADSMTLSGDCGVQKPDPEIFRIALRKVGCEPDQAVMIGDSYEMDVVGAVSAGVLPIWFKHSPGPPQLDYKNTLKSFLPTESTINYILQAFENRSSVMRRDV